MDDSNNPKSTQRSAGKEANNWRERVPKEIRVKIVQKIVSALVQHYKEAPFPQIQKMAFRFEGAVFAAATSQELYIQTINEKMRPLVKAARTNALHSLPSAPANSAQDPGDQGQIRKPDQPFQNPLDIQSQECQHSSTQKFFNTAHSEITPLDLTQIPTPKDVDHTRSQDTHGNSQVPMGNSAGPDQSLSNIANRQRHVPGSQHLDQNTPQQHLQPPFNRPNHSNNQQMQQQILEQDVILPSSLQSSQKSMMHGSLAEQPSLMQTKSLADQQSFQQSQQPVDQNNPESILKMHQQFPLVHAEKSPSGQPELFFQKQQKLTGQLQTSSNNQQGGLNGKQSGVSEMQHRQQWLSTDHHSTIHLQQLSGQSNLSRFLGPQSAKSNIGTGISTHIKPQVEVSLQQKPAKPIPDPLLAHGREPKPEPHEDEKLRSQIQSASESLLEHPQSIHEEMKQTTQVSDSLLQSHELIIQRKQLFQSQTSLPAASANLKLESGQVDEDTWREEIHQSLETLKKLFLPELKQIYYKLAANYPQIGSAPQPKNPAMYRIKVFIKLLMMDKNQIAPQQKELIGRLEKEFVDFFKFQELRRSNSSQQQKPQPLPTVHPLQDSSFPLCKNSASNLPDNHLIPECGQNIKPLQSGTNMLQGMQLKQQDELGMTKFHLGKRQYPQDQLVLQALQPQRELFNLQPPVELHAHKKTQGCCMNVTEVMNEKQEMSDLGAHVQHNSSRKQLVKPKPPSLNSSLQPVQEESIQLSQNPVPKKKQRNLPNSPVESRTPLLIATPGLSVSPLLEVSESTDNDHGNFSIAPSESSVVEQPIQRLIRVVNSMSSTTLRASVDAMESVVGLVERIAGPLPGIASAGVVGEDLVAMTRYHLQERNSNDFNVIRGGTLRCYPIALPQNTTSNGAMNVSFRQLIDSEISDLESTANFPNKRTEFKASKFLVDEITKINRRLINTVVELSDENASSTTDVPCTEASQATIVKCSFIAVSVTPSVRSALVSEKLLPIQPLKLLIPGSYPDHSPLVLDKLSTVARMDDEDLSVKANLKFSARLRNFEQPYSLEEIAKAWDDCAYRVFCEYAGKNGGGIFSSQYGMWERCAYAS